MKARAFTGTLLLILLALSAHIAYPQTPQGISYQTVIRDGSGNPIANKLIGLKITLQNASELAYYTETHTTTSTGQGVISVIIGGGTKVGTNKFASIPWQNGDVYIKLDIDPSGGTSYTTMGTASKLQSVPYALYADNTKEIVSNPNALDDDPIFEVKNKLGQVVFGVYQGGVRVYVEDTQIKGAKGGFAIGGLTNQAKYQQEYFRITPDSARIFFKDVPTGKGAKGGFAIGGLTNQAKTVVSHNLMFVAHDSTRIYIDDSITSKDINGGFAIGGLKNQLKHKKSNFFNIETKSNYIINPSQPRILWYPLKNAFLVGQVLIENPDSVGTNSFSSGYESKAEGNYSQALGYRAIARGTNSTAMGTHALAVKLNSFALGDSAQAYAASSYAFGTRAKASGWGSFAFGSVGRDTTGNALPTNTTASGEHAFAIGLGAQASALNSFSIGTKSVASGSNSTSLGYYSIASGPYSLAINGGTASGKYSMSYRGTASGENSIAFGPFSIASGIYSFALGGGKWAENITDRLYTQASGNYSYAMGYNSTASGVFSFSLGRNDVAKADYSYVIGDGLVNNSYRSIVIGQFNDTLIAANMSTWIVTDPLFTVGNGTINLPSNALVIYKNGDMMIKGNIYPQADNTYNFGTITNRWKTIYSANGTIQTSDIRLKDHIKELNYGLAEILMLKPVSFQWKNNPDDGSKIGFIAQDVQPIIKEVVEEGKDVNKTLGINYTSFIPIMIKAMQEQQKMIDNLQQENTLLKKEVKDLEELRTELESIKAMIKK